MVSHVMADIVLKRLITSSRLVSSVLQSFCKMGREKWMRFISASARLAMSSSAFGLLCGSCVTVLSPGLTVKITRRLSLMDSRCVDGVRFDEAVVVDLVHDGGRVVTVLNNGIVVQPDEVK